MGKAKKQTALWKGFAQGSLLALGAYLLGLMLLALLVVRGALPESGCFPAVAAWCGASALLGGLLAVWRTAIRGGGLVTGAVFAAVLAVTALCCWDETAWLGQGGILLLCALGGGLLAGLLRSGKRRKRK